MEPRLRCRLPQPSLILFGGSNLLQSHRLSGSWGSAESFVSALLFYRHDRCDHLRCCLQKPAAHGPLYSLPGTSSVSSVS